MATSPSRYPRTSPHFRLLRLDRRHLHCLQSLWPHQRSVAPTSFIDYCFRRFQSNPWSAFWFSSRFPASFKSTDGGQPTYIMSQLQQFVQIPQDCWPGFFRFRSTKHFGASGANWRRRFQVGERSSKAKASTSVNQNMPTDASKPQRRHEREWNVNSKFNPEDYPSLYDANRQRVSETRKKTRLRNSPLEKPLLPLPRTVDSGDNWIRQVFPRLTDSVAL